MTALSKSELWSRMHEYYDKIGVGAWEAEIVPSLITSNQLLAKIYANLVVSHIIDWLNHNNKTKQGPDEPFNIIEIGAGHGKFSFYLLCQLQEALAAVGYPLSYVRYIMTDISEKHIRCWQQQPQFKQFIDDGILHFAQFDAYADSNGSFSTIDNGITIKNHSLSTPLFIICNYLFDTLSHDAFQIIDGKLNEIRLKIDSEADWQNYFENANYKFSAHPIDDVANYYDDKLLNEILTIYATEFYQASFLIPIGGLQCCKRLAKLSTQHTALLLGDKGNTNSEFFAGLEDPDINLHGSVSFCVNFHALAQYFTLKAGSALLMPNINSEFQIAFFTNCGNNFPLTRLAFHNNCNAITPQDLVNLCYPKDEINESYDTLDEILSILNASLWDPSIFFDLHEQLIDLIDEDINQENLSLDQEQAIIIGTEKVWQAFFKLEKTQDIPFALGSVYYSLDNYKKASMFFDLSNKEFGDCAENFYNLALCHESQDDFIAAEKCLLQAVELDHKYKPAVKMLNSISKKTKQTKKTAQTAGKIDMVC